MKGTRELNRREYAIDRFRVSVIRGPDAPRVLDSDGIELTVGTAPGNDLRLSDSSVSRHHCSFTVTDDGVELRDLGSTNGTSLGPFRVGSAYMSPGATVTIGQSVLRFDPLDGKTYETVSRSDRFGEVLGCSLAMRRVFAMLERVAPSDSTILIEGETGVGKGLVAEAIHEASPRAGGPFVVVDCGAIPHNLLESELFGHEAGAFTGAREGRIGFFEAAHGGTLFLDEIGELPLDLQPKLLRAVEKHEIRRVGNYQPIPVDVRIVAATNRDLRREVNAGTFRSDLWYRLNIVRLVIPPLRERREDIPMLVSHFYRQMGPPDATQPPAELITALKRGEWRGNVRELASAVERSLIFEDRLAGDVLPETADDDPLSFDPQMSFRAAKTRAVTSWEKRWVEQLINFHDGNISQAARGARMDRSHLRTLLRRLGIAIPRRRGTES